MIRVPENRLNITAIIWQSVARAQNPLTLCNTAAQFRKQMRAVTAIRFPPSSAVIFVLLFSSWIVASAEQQRKLAPPELQASDPEIRSLLESTQEVHGCSGIERSISILRRAEELSTSRKLLSDKALIEDALGGLLFLNGKLDDARQMFISSFQDALSSGNLGVQADVLVALAIFDQTKETPQAGMELLQQALQKAKKAKSLFLQSRVLGELGRSQVAAGLLTEARSSLEEAIRIDEINQYDWLPGHKLYFAWLLATESNKQLDDAMQTARLARSLAIKKENYLVFVQATTSLAQGFVRKGDSDRAITLLEETRDGNDPELTSGGVNLEDYRCALNSPILHLMLLETLAPSYQAAKRTDASKNTWLEIYQVAEANGINLLAAESTHTIADYFASLKDNTQAAKYYSIAAKNWRAVGNEKRLISALIGLSAASFNLGENEVGRSQAEEILRLAKKQGNDVLQFAAEFEIGRAFYREKNYDSAAPHFVRVEELAAAITPDKLDKKSLLATYTLLADCYQSSHQTIERLLVLENALVLAAEINDPILRTVYGTVQQEIETLLSKESPETLTGTGDLFGAFLISELRYNFQYTQALAQRRDKAWLQEANPDLSRIISLPDQIVWQPDGADKLQKHLERAGTVGAVSKGATLLALARRYAVRGDNPDLAQKFSQGAIVLFSGSGTGNRLLSTYAHCYLATALAQSGKLKEAGQEVKICLSATAEVNDPQLVFVSNASAAFVYSVTQDYESAKKALSYLLEKSPTDPNLYEQIADTFGELAKYDQQLASLQTALRMRSDNTTSASVPEAELHLKIAQVLASHFPNKAGDAENHFRSATQMFAGLSNESGQVKALLALATYYSTRKQREKAETTFDQALELAKHSTIPQLTPNVLSQWAEAHLSADEFNDALQMFRQASELYHGLAQSSLEAISLRGVAISLNRLHQGEKALDVAESSVSLADVSGAPFGRYWTRRTLAWICEDQGRFARALEVLREARAISQSAGQAKLAGWASLSSTYVLQVLGDWEQALKEANSAVDIFRDLGDTEDLITAYSVVIDAYGSRESPLKDLGKALEIYEQTKTLSTDPHFNTTIYSAAVEVLWQMKRYEEAERLCFESLKVFQATKNRVGEANALITLAEVQRDSGKLTDAARSLRQAESLMPTFDDLYSLGRLHYNKAGLLKKQRQFDRALLEYEQVIKIAEKAKSWTTGDLQRSFTENYGFVYDEFIDTFYRASQIEPSKRIEYASKSFAYNEANKARTFLNAWGSIFASTLRKRLPSDIQERERELLARIDTDRADLESGKTSEKDKQTVRQELVQTEHDFQLFLSHLRSAYPGYAELEYPRTLTSLSAIPLKRGEILVEFRIIDNAILVWIVKGTPSGNELLEFYENFRTRDWLRSRVRRIRESLTNPDDFDTKTCEELFNALFPNGHVTPLLSADSIIIIPDDYLNLIPFELLSPTASKNNFIFRSKEMKYFPSAMSLSVARAAQRNSKWSKQFLGVADPITSTADERFAVVSIERSRGGPDEGGKGISQQITEAKLVRGLPSLDRIPATASEVTGIANLFSAGQAETRIGVSANKPTLLATDLRPFRFVHFATHGIMPDESGLSEPALVLSYDGHPNDMVLRMSEIVDLDLNAEMVVLSACNTGTGKVSRTEGVYNLGRAVLSAGASSVVVSLWQVADNSTEILMRELYKNIQSGKSKSKSLALAREALSKSDLYNKPFYWAPFVLIGD